MKTKNNWLILFFILSFFIIYFINTYNEKIQIDNNRKNDLQKIYNIAEVTGKKLSKKHGVNVLIYDEFGNIFMKSSTPCGTPPTGFPNF